LKEVLDTRLFIEFFYSKNTEVRRKVREKIIKLSKDRQGLVPSVVLAELSRVICEKHGYDEARISYLSVLQSGLDVVPLTSELARDAGILGCRYKKLPMGDCIVAAVAVKAKANVISDDPHFDEIKEVSRAWVK
jgi:predicted nucleic acid-binding protein